MDKGYLEIGKKYLITTDNWFITPNGRQYRSVFGTVHAIKDADTTLGLKTNRNSTNWYVVIGNMVIAGCQIHYIVQADNIIQEDQVVVDFEFHEGEVRFNEAPPRIYRADTEYSETARDPVSVFAGKVEEDKKIKVAFGG